MLHRLCVQASARLASKAVSFGAASSLPAARQVRRCSTAAAEIPEVDIDKIAYGFMASQSMFAALETGVFDEVERHQDGVDIDTLKDKLGVNAPRLQTLLTALAAHGFVRRSAEGLYTNTKQTSSCLVEGAKHYYGDYLKLQVGRQFYGRLADLGKIITSGEAPTYTSWFSDPAVARTYTVAQHNGSVATAKQLVKRVDVSNVKQLLDVGGGSGAFSIVLARKYADLSSVVLELPEVAEVGRSIVAEEPADVASRVSFTSGTALADFPVEAGTRDCVLMSYISGSVPASLIPALYEQAYKVLKPGGRLIVHDFMVDDSLTGPPLAALWAVQHIAVNAEGLGLCPANVTEIMKASGFENVDPSIEMITGLTKVVVATKAA